MREVERLSQLQDLDSLINEMETRLQVWAERRLRQQQALEAARRSQEKGEQALQKQELRIRQAERSCQETESRLKDMQKRLYSDAIRSAKEASALQTEIEQLRQQKNSLEDEALGLMLELDEMREELAAISAETQKRMAEHAATLQEADEQEAALHQQLAQLRVEREELTAAIPSKNLALYEQLRRTRGGRAVAQVQNNTCGGCHLEVAFLTRKAALGDNLVCCENCGRILHMS